LSITGILKPDEALSGFANAGLMTVAAMFIVAAAIRASGGVDLVVERVLGRPTGPRSALVRLMLPVVSLSAFLNNTPVVATMIPAVSQWARRIKVPSSSLMIPLSYASILGGTITLIGTSTNLVVNGQYQVLTGKPGFALFDFAPIGLIVALAGTLFVVFAAPRLLKARRSPDQTFADTRSFTFEVAVARDGPLVGKTIQHAGLRHLERIYLAEIERDGSVITAVAPEEILRGGDRLVFVGETEAIVDVLRINGLVAAVGSQPALERNVPERRLVEAVVAEHCDVVGHTIRDGRFRDRYGAVVMAASASFATPIGYQCNLMVYGPGGYRFSDFLRIGVPMNLLMALVTIAVIPFIWPLQG
jgi:di/tricarboxylate transporter